MKVTANLAEVIALELKLRAAESHVGMFKQRAEQAEHREAMLRAKIVKALSDPGNHRQHGFIDVK